MPFGESRLQRRPNASPLEPEQRRRALLAADRLLLAVPRTRPVHRDALGGGRVAAIEDCRITQLQRAAARRAVKLAVGARSGLRRCALGSTFAAAAADRGHRRHRSTGPGVRVRARSRRACAASTAPRRRDRDDGRADRRGQVAVVLGRDLGDGDRARRRPRARSTRRPRPSARPQPAAADQLRDQRPTGSSSRAGAAATARAQPALVAAAVGAASTGAGGRSRSRARPRPRPRRARRARRGRRSRAPPRCGGGSRAPGRAASAWSRRSCRSRPATSSCESPSERAHHQHGPLAVGQPVDVAEQRAGLGAVGELVRRQRGAAPGTPSSSTSPTRPGPRAAQLVDARVVDEPQQPRRAARAAPRPPRRAPWTRRKTSCRTSSGSCPEAYSSRAA